MFIRSRADVMLSKEDFRYIGTKTKHINRIQSKSCGRARTGHQEETIRKTERINRKLNTPLAYNEDKAGEVNDGNHVTIRSELAIEGEIRGFHGNEPQSNGGRGYDTV